TGVLTQLSLAGTTSIEQRLLERSHAAPETPRAMAMTASPAMAMSGAAMSGAATLGGAMSGSGAMTGGPAMVGGAAMTSNAMMMSAKPPGGAALDPEGQLPSLAGAETWLNSTPLTADTLRGKVVVIDFWTYSCINCLRAIPYVRAWADKYAGQGLVVIGVHSP